MQKNSPYKISETNGVSLWKVRDSTPGGADHVYFTTPAYSTYWVDGGKNPTYHLVGGLTFNNQRVYVEDNK